MFLPSLRTECARDGIDNAAGCPPLHCLNLFVLALRLFPPPKNPARPLVREPEADHFSRCRAAVVLWSADVWKAEDPFCLNCSLGLGALEVDLAGT